MHSYELQIGSWLEWYSATSPSHAEIWSGFNLYMFCALCHCTYEFVCAFALVCLENTVSLELASAWGKSFFMALGRWEMAAGVFPWR